MFNFPFKIDSLGQQISVKSAVNPSLWACAVISLPLFYFATKVSSPLQIIFIVIAAIPVAIFAFSYLYLLLVNPDYLRSEEYHIKMQSLKLLGDKDNPLGAKADDIVAINNPKLPSPQQQIHE